MSKKRKGTCRSRRNAYQRVLSQFKTEQDVSKFLKKLHSQVLEQMLQGEMDVHLAYEKNSIKENNTGSNIILILLNI